MIKIANENIKDRLNDFETRVFDNALNIGARYNYFLDLIPKKINKLITTEFDYILAKQANLNLVCDDEALPFKENSFDLIFSVLNGHFINDLPGFLSQTKKILKPNGLFIFIIFGGRTLEELREVFLNFEMNHKSGVSPHIIPMIDIRDMAALMQRANFSKPIVDNFYIDIEYNNIVKLMHDLRFMGESNCLLKKANYTINKNDLPILNEIYHNLHGINGKLKTTFEIITATGFKE